MSTAIPIIDCSKVISCLEDYRALRLQVPQEDFVQQLGDGMTSSGFVYFVNHGLDSRKIQRVFKTSREFFQLPRDIKENYSKSNAEIDYFGYTDPKDEILNESDKTAIEIKEAFDFWGNGSFDASRYPREIPEFFDIIKEFRESLVPITEIILRALAMYLNLPDHNFFLQHHQAFLRQDSSISSFNNCRTNFYPKLCTEFDEIPPGTLRLTEHQDWGTLTFLIQDDVAGLEAKLRDDTWIPVTPIPGGLLLNAGLMLEMWSGGRIHAAPHRVRFVPGSSDKDRQSLVFFLQPDNHVSCRPLLPEVPGWNPLYPQMTPSQTFIDYYRDRIQGTRRFY